MKTWFHEYLKDAPTWTIRRRESVNVLIDGTWFRNKLCLVVYRDNTARSTLFYRLTDKETEWEIIKDIQMIKSLGITISSVTTDGGQDIVRALKCACPEVTRQRYLAHIERECLLWLTQNQKTSACIRLRRLVCQIGKIKTHNDELNWKRCFHD